MWGTIIGRQPNSTKQGQRRKSHESVRPTCGRNPYQATRHKQLPACVKSAFNKEQLNAQDAFAKWSSCRPAEQVSLCTTENAHRRVTTNDAEHRAQLVFDNGGVKPVTAEANAFPFVSSGTRCRGITPVQHAGGAGFNPQRVYTSIEGGIDVPFWVEMVLNGFIFIT